MKQIIRVSGKASIVFDVIKKLAEERRYCTLGQLEKELG
jgi:hypothetical protein